METPELIDSLKSQLREAETYHQAGNAEGAHAMLHSMRTFLDDELGNIDNTPPPAPETPPPSEKPSPTPDGSPS